MKGKISPDFLICVAHHHKKMCRSKQLAEDETTQDPYFSAYPDTINWCSIIVKGKVKFTNKEVPEN